MKQKITFIFSTEQSLSLDAQKHRGCELLAAFVCITNEYGKDITIDRVYIGPADALTGEMTDL